MARRVSSFATRGRGRFDLELLEFFDHIFPRPSPALHYKFEQISAPEILRKLNSASTPKPSATRASGSVRRGFADSHFLLECDKDM
jgi:hypothetical protein